MRRRLRLALLLLLLAAFAFAVRPARAGQDPWDEDPLAPAKPEDDGVATHEVVEHFPDTTTVSARYMADEWGRPHGPYNSFHPDGSPKIRAHYRQGVLWGAYQSYWPGGAPKEVANYAKGELDKTYTLRNQAGDVVEKSNYQRGVLHGDRMLPRAAHGTAMQRWADGQLVSLVVALPSTPESHTALLRAFPRSIDELRKNLYEILGNEQELEDTGVRAWWSKPDGAAPRGRDKSQRLLHALRRLKAYRYLVEVPHKELVLDEKYNYYCEWGAKLCEAIGRLDHTPKNEPNWPEAEYRDGYNGTSHSNLSNGAPVEYSPDSYMDDSDQSNVDRVGHRCWCVNPAMGKTGFGFSPSDRFSAMWSMDASGKGGGSAQTVFFPAPGYHPTGFFGGHYAWSVHFRGKQPRDAKIAVVPLDRDYAPAGAPLPFKYQRSGQSGYGMSGICIFQPEGVSTAPGSKYWVEIQWKGNVIQYLVEFCSVAPPKPAIAGPDGGK